MRNLSTKQISNTIALAGLRIGAIKIRPDKPFLWASGTYNPIYNDNRMFLFHPEYRNFILYGFMEMITPTDNFVIAGTSTSGIPWATLLANDFSVPLIYVRDKPKDHGLKNQIEGIDAEKDLGGREVILIEDLVSTGGSSVAAVDAIRKANGNCNLCISIFNYGLPLPKRMFAGDFPYNKNGDMLKEPCEIKSLLYYPQLLSVGIKNGFIKEDEENILLEWMEDQQHWGQNHVSKVKE